MTQAEHRTPQQLTDLLRQVIDAAARNDGDTVKGLMSPLFVDEDWCCLYAFTGGLLEITKQGMPPVAPGRPVALAAHPGCGHAEVLWGRMVVEHLRGHPQCVLDLFHEGLADGTVGAAVAVGVAAVGLTDRKRRARLQ